MYSRRIYVVAVECQKPNECQKFAAINTIPDVTIITSDITFGIQMQSVVIWDIFSMNKKLFLSWKQ